MLRWPWRSRSIARADGKRQRYTPPMRQAPSQSFHAVYEPSILDALREAVEHGFDGVQLAMDAPHLGFEALDLAQRRQIASFRERHGLRIALHAPDDMASLYEHRRTFRSGIFAYFGELLQFADDIGARIITVHPGRATTYPTDEQPRTRICPLDLEAYRQTFAENLARLIDLVGGRFVLCMENLAMDDMVRSIIGPHLSAGSLFLCWDLPKTYNKMVLDEPLETFLWQHLPSIRQVHLHDADAQYTHRAVGTGGIDFGRYLPRLLMAGVIDFCHEVRPLERALVSRRNFQRLIAEQSPAGDNMNPGQP